MSAWQFTLAGVIACAAGCGGKSAATEDGNAPAASAGVAAQAAGSGAQAAAPAVDVCALFSAAEASTVVGQDIGITNKTAAGDIPHGYCQYTSTTPEDQRPAGADGAFLEVRVYDDRGVASTGDHPNAASLYRGLKQAFAARGDQLTPVSGLGEDAFGNAGILRVLDGAHLETSVSGVVLGPDGPARRLEVVKQVATVVLGKL